MSTTWQHEFVQRIDGLDRYIQRRVVINPDPSDELVSTRAFANADQLRQALNRASSSTLKFPTDGTSRSPYETVDLHVMVSRFTRHYSASMTAAALIGLSHGLGLDLSIDRGTQLIRNDIPFCLVLGVSDHDVAQSAERSPTWPVSGPTVETHAQLREHVWGRLYGEHLRPVFEQLIQLTKVTANFLWSNAAEWPGMISSFAIEYLDETAAAAIVAECSALFEAAALPGVPGPNPLADKLDWVPGDGKGHPDPVVTRRACCLQYLHEGRYGRLCQTCPYLPVDDRIALVRERHGVPMGVPGGPAEKRAIEVGLARSSAQHMTLLKQRTQG